jgi:hypothetical protein
MLSVFGSRTNAVERLEALHGRQFIHQTRNPEKIKPRRSIFISAMVTATYEKGAATLQAQAHVRATDHAQFQCLNGPNPSIRRIRRPSSCSAIRR